MRRSLIRSMFWLVGAAVAMTPMLAGAQAYPTKPIRIVVPYPPGGATDGLVRPLAQYMTEALGRTVLVENKPGANGIVGTESVAKSPPDGYTLVLGAIGPFAVSGSMQSLPYDPVRDFAPIGFLAAVPNVLVVHPSLPVRSVTELVTLARSKPDEMTYGSAGPGSSNQLASELFNLAAGLKIRHVPYKGGSAAQVDLISGQISMMFDNMPPSIPHIQSGKFRALAVTSLKRQPQLPDVPTMDELGYKGFEAGSWFGLLAPNGTPAAIVDKLNALVVQAMNMPVLRQRYESLGYALNPGSSAAFAAFMNAEREKWAKVVAQAGIKAN